MIPSFEFEFWGCSGLKGLVSEGVSKSDFCKQMDHFQSSLSTLTSTPLWNLFELQQNVTAEPWWLDASSPAIPSSCKQYCFVRTLSKHCTSSHTKNTLPASTSKPIDKFVYSIFCQIVSLLRHCCQQEMEVTNHSGAFIPNH